MSKYFNNKVFNFLEIIGYEGKPFVPKTVFEYLLKSEYKAYKRYFSKWRVSFKEMPDSKIRASQIVISGEYDFDEDRITIFIQTKVGLDSVKMTESKLDKFAYDIIITVMHEMIHRKQFKFRDDYNYMYYEFASTMNMEDLEYYSDCDEVAAYAHCLFTELKTQFPKESLRDILLRDKLKSPVLRIYRSLYTRDDETLKMLYHHTFRWERKYNK